jgi:predicted  nucleic acid-binding Zn-ribbon protein
MRAFWVLPLAVAGVAAAGHAAEKPMRFWNLTTVDIGELYLAPAGTDTWSTNQTLNDDNKSVEADERLEIRGIKPGKYDVRLKDLKGRSCLVKNVEVKSGGKYAFSIDDKELTDCTQ